jgi:hypothetical protein
MASRRYSSKKRGSKKRGSKRHGSRSKKHSIRGGVGNAPASAGISAADYELRTVGPLDIQARNALTTHPGVPITATSAHSNAIRGLAGQSAGGKRRRHHKGGYWQQVIQQAATPFALLGLQQSFGKKTRKSRR